MRAALALARKSSTGARRFSQEGTLAYHLRQLADAGLLANARSLPHRGPVEHLYVLTPKGVKLAAVLNELPDMV